MTLYPAHILHDGNAFHNQHGVLMAAPVLDSGSIEWVEAVEVTEDSDSDPGIIAQIARALGIRPRA